MSEFVLTSEQQAVVDADLHGPRLVDAGAGTGKTFTLVERARALIARGDLRPDQLLIVTFTKAAATEIAARLEAVLDPNEHRRPTCGTFHGIASDLVREFAYEAGIAPDIRVIDDGRARGLFARAFDDLKAGRLAVDLSAFPLLDRTKVLERSLATIVLKLKQNGADVAGTLARAREAAAGLEALPFGAVKELKQNGQPRAGWPRPDPERTAEERFAEAQRERQNVDVVIALFARFQAFLDAECLLTFGDVIVRATAMLHTHPMIADTLRRRWRHAIVDEFQDTNRTQTAFLEALFGTELRPVFVVGDVRQAIYEFNGADPRGIIEFRSRARETLPLTLNRRSFQPILDVAYHTLAALGGVERELNQKLAAHRGAAAPVCVKVELFTGPDALEREAATVADGIRNLIHAGASPRQCAVLLRTRTKANAYASALRERGLAVQLYGGVGFFDAPEIRETVAWLRLANDPTDPFATLAALQSAAIGLGDGAVAELARDGTLARAALLDDLPAAFDADERERLARFRRIARLVCALGDVRLVDAIRTVVSASGAEIARLDDPALPQVRANLDKLVRFAADLASDRPLARIRDLVEELNERDALELDLPLAELEGERVAIMTIHGAKGLEWDHVFLANVSGSTFPLVNNDARENVVQLDPPTGALAFKTGVDGRPNLRWYMARHAHDDRGIVASAQAPEYSEEFRLLYVALTRARDALYVTGRRGGNNYISPCLKAVEAWASEVSGTADSHRLSSQPAIRAVAAPAAVAAFEAERELTLFQRLARLTEGAVLPLRRRGALSYTAMELHERCPRRARYHYVLGLPTLADDAPPNDATYDGDERETRDPARYGRVVHKVLELLAKARMTGGAFDIDAALEDALAEEEWQPSATLRSNVRRAVEAARAALASLTPIDAERRFELTIGETRLAGYIDFIGTDESGRPVIVDYKTGLTEGEHYALQFALYQHAVRDDFPSATTRLLRVGDQRAVFEEIAAATEAELAAAIDRSSSMESDEPRPGRQCAYCPYAHDVCDAAPIGAA